MDEKKKGILSILGLIFLLITCVIGVQAIFIGLGMAIPNEERVIEASSQSQIIQSGNPSENSGTTSAQSAPSFCPFCGEGLPSSFQWGQYCPYCGEPVKS